MGEAIECGRKYLIAKGNTRATYWVPLAIVACVFAIAAGWHITLPGLYYAFRTQSYLSTAPIGHW